MEVTVEWMETNPVEAAEILTPDFVDENQNEIDDRGEKLHEMVVNSGEVYNWGWRGYWWGWRGYWQSGDNFDQDGFWQNFNFQTLRLE